MEIKECPQCGAPTSPSAKCCEYCKAEFFVTSLAYLSNFEESAVKKYLQAYKKMAISNPDDIEGHMGLALCYLQTKCYPLALKEFQKIVDDFPDVALAYYYECLAMIGGRRIKILPLKDIKMIETLLDTAIQIDNDNGIYKLLLGIVRYDYFVLNNMKINGSTPNDLIQEAFSCQIETKEVERLCTSIIAEPKLIETLKTMVNNQTKE